MTSDGVKVRYVDEGKPELATIIFVHGGPGFNSSYLRYFARSLTSNVRTILYDQRGCGVSQRDIDTQSVTLDRCIQDLYELQNFLKIPTSVILGQSFGGTVALEYALAHSELVQGLIIENGFVDSKMEMDDRLQAAGELAEKTDNAVISAIIDRYRQGEELTFEEHGELCGEDTDGLYWFDLEKAKSCFVVGGPSEWGYQSEQIGANMVILKTFYEQGLFTEYSILDRASEIKKPTLIVTGRHDRIITVRQAESLANRISDSRLRIFEESGHYPHIEEPDPFRREIHDFLSVICE